MVPTVVTQLEGDRAKVRTAVVAGSVVPLLMFVLWNGAILGAADPNSATFDPLEALRNGAGGPVLGASITAFSEFAIVTSFIGFVFGLRDFLSDAAASAGLPGEVAGMDSEGGGGGGGGSDVALKSPIYATILLPPLAFALGDPEIFFKALDSAGAFGITVLFGIVPAAMAWIQRQRQQEGGGLTMDDVEPPSTAVEAATARLVPGGNAPLALMIAIAVGLIVENAVTMLGPV